MHRGHHNFCAEKTLKITEIFLQPERKGSHSLSNLQNVCTR